MQKKKFKHIGIVGRIDNVQAINSLKQLTHFLDTKHVNIILSETTANALIGHTYQVGSDKILGEISDLIVVVGGDGSLLGAARSFAKYSVPILGINRGRLGFLTDIAPDEIDCKFNNIFHGDYIEDHRFMLACDIKRERDPINKSSALNDIVLHRGKSTRMIEFELHIDGQFVYSQRSDGLIVATSTGSTAYALSAGGPIIHPKLDALVLVPMFPHTLTSRPIVVDGSSDIRIVIGVDNDIYPRISCDGQTHYTASPGDTICIKKLANKVKLIHPKEHDYYEICRRKLGWGSKLGQ